MVEFSKQVKKPAKLHILKTAARAKRTILVTCITILAEPDLSI